METKIINAAADVRHGKRSVAGKLLLASVLAAGVGGTAFAGEGGRDPFPFGVPGAVVRNAPLVADTGSSAYPEMPSAFAFAPTGGPVIEASGQESVVQTAQSLPQGALDGTVAYAQQQSVARYFAQQAARHYATVHGTRPVS